VTGPAAIPLEPAGGGSSPAAGGAGRARPMLGPLLRAAAVIRSHADDIRDCSTDEAGNWDPGDETGEADYLTLVEIADELEQLHQQLTGEVG
jgi:hypothetical protein